MSKKGYSIENIWGGYDHYDEHGKKIGSSSPNIWGGFNEYDAKGKKIGNSAPNIWGGYNHYDARGKKTGSSQPDILNTGYNHYDARGKKTGSSTRGAFHDYNHYGKSGSGNFSGSSSQGCYIATCVYGDYNCAPVWTLRRFRDDYLAKRGWGKLFIRTYYRINPKLVARFGNNKMFRILWKAFLDKMVGALRRKSYSCEPYADR